MNEIPEPQSFEEFWPYYVSQHLHPVNRALHVTGTTLGLVCAASTPAYPPALLAAPVFGYGLSWVGHFLFERNRPASWHSAKHFAWSFRGDLRMLRLTYAGRMGPELDRARHLMDEQGEQTASQAYATA